MTRLRRLVCPLLRHCPLPWTSGGSRDRYDAAAREWLTENCGPAWTTPRRTPSLAALLRRVADEARAEERIDRRALVERAVRAGTTMLQYQVNDANIALLAARILAAHEAEKEKP
jgi:hypothetical protein